MDYKMLQGDCIRNIKMLEDGSIDAAVMDPFAGSGSTGVACMNTGRDFIGIELDKDYAATAVQRIEAAREKTEKEKPAE